MRESRLDNIVFKICNVKVHALQTDTAIEIISDWLVNDRRFHYLSSTNVNNVIISIESKKYREVMENADISLPDAVPFLWFGRLQGFNFLKRRCGIEEVMEAVFDLSNKNLNYSHFFYGNTPEVLKILKLKLLLKYPKLKISGMLSPPFRPLTPEEDKEHIKLINDSKSDFLWVSLGCPKQETWLYDHRKDLNVIVGGGAGAVFNFLSGNSFKAPNFIRYLGLEWFLRFLLEPKRLWRRYLVKYPKFIFYFTCSLIGFKKEGVI
jgi:N-acetylglucosaminyldiphosphoundecaprenol N-acetyl-beta-D-mannosaminyltransferase